MYDNKVSGVEKALFRLPDLFFKLQVISWNHLFVVVQKKQWCVFPGCKQNSKPKSSSLSQQAALVTEIVDFIRNHFWWSSHGWLAVL